ncbi:hypothetical protein, partial [Parabacteroides chinchillae]
MPVNYLLILYVGTQKRLDICSREISNYLVKLLSTYYQLHLLGDLFPEQSYEQGQSYDLIIIQNSLSFIRYKKQFKRLGKSPALFIATTNRLDSYIAPFKNLYGVLSMSDAALPAFGIPEEMMLH